MQQLTQQLKSGQMEILEVPFPALTPGSILVRNYYSVISAGTESKTVTDARKGYIAKARSRQKEVKQVIEMIKTNGLVDTYKLVMNKLEAPSALGYSCAGEVIGVGGDVQNIKVGDFVACGGAAAVHADVVAVPKNLCVVLPSGIDLKQAAFATIAAIAIQGIRQADLKFGEIAVVIGLGLIGQITVQILQASGIKAIGIDIDEHQIKQTNELKVLAYNRSQEGLEKIILQETYGFGADAVIITAGSKSTDPINLAGDLSRKKGKVIIVGAVPTGFEREKYYKKELELLMSCSYGPGRYDIQYEEKGIDYPIGHVRWTENRNMQSYIDLLCAGKLQMNKTISHIFTLEQAPEAYNMIIEKSESYTGILIEYEKEKSLNQKVELNNISTKSNVNAGFIGAGNFAQNMLLPRLKDLCNFTGVATARGNTSRYVADKYKFNYCTNNADEIITDSNTNTIFIATRHNQHAEFVLKGLDAGQNIFVEKPLAMNIEELNEIEKSYLKNSKDGKSSILMVGYNRRFAPFTKELKKIFKDEQPKSMNFRINAGAIPKEHWVNDIEIGGGRVIGEACHFIDLAMYIAGSKIKSVMANSIKDVQNLIDTIIISLTFENGSIANISYFSNGNKSLSKEYYEIFCDGTVVIIDDFCKMNIYGKAHKKEKSKQDKGHTQELIEFTNAIKNGLASPIPFDELFLSTLVSFKVLESIKENRIIQIN